MSCTLVESAWRNFTGCCNNRKREAALTTCVRPVRMKQCRGVISGKTAKLVSPTRPLDVEAMPAEDTARSTWKRLAAGIDVSERQERDDKEKSAVPRIDSPCKRIRSMSVTLAQALKRGQYRVCVYRCCRCRCRWVAHLGAQYACIRPRVKGNSLAKSCCPCPR
jgi:hypothetical protein